MVDLLICVGYVGVCGFEVWFSLCLSLALGVMVAVWFCYCWWGLVGLIVSGCGFSLFRFLQFSVWFYGCS